MSMLEVEHEYVEETPDFQERIVGTENISVSASNMNKIYDSF